MKKLLRWADSLPGTSVSHDARCGIFQAPDDLPEGQYQVTFGGQTNGVQKRDGYWVSAQSY
jgi:hypothetical protein